MKVQAMYENTEIAQWYLFGQSKDKNSRLGGTTQETTNRRETQSYHAYQSGNLTKPYQAYQPLTNQTLKSKSDKPVTEDKAKSEKGTELSLDVGSLGWSY
ncbi:hypothetical protein VoSk93_43680 [Vibrio owensii]